jgi:hypothetical protein
LSGSTSDKCTRISRTGATLSLRHSGHISLIWLPTGKTSATFHEDLHLTEYFLGAQRAAGWDCRLIRT